MVADAATLRAALPARLRDRWDRIALIEADLDAALAGETQADVAALGEERARCIEAFCADFPLDPQTAGLRSMALRHLLAMNDVLGAAARRELAAAGEVAATARRQRKAISAYHENQPES
jgi:hypothetical protein